MTGHQPHEALLEVLHHPLASNGLDLEGIEISSAGRRRVLRVLVDKDGGVTLDDIAHATRVVSAELDESDVMGEAPYTLEVTSPGIDRPLTLPRHWRRNVDRLVKITLSDGSDLVGRITASAEDSATIDAEGATQEIVYAEVSSARIEIEFNRPRTRVTEPTDPPEEE